MTIAVHHPRVVSRGVRSVCAQQLRLLKRLESVQHYLGGIVAGLWLPGIDSTFDDPKKKVTGRRPVFLTLEVADNGSLNFTGAISRLRDDQLVFSPIFSYDVALVYAPRGGGKTLPANNLVLARRANELLSALVAFGRDVSFGTHRELSPAVFPDIVCDANGTIFEDYTPVLGLRVDNPAKAVQTVKLQRYNPASKILARHGREDAKDCPQPQFDQIVAEFRSEFPEVTLELPEILAALSDPSASFFTFTVPFEVALATDPQAAVAAMRAVLPPRYAADAGYHDLLLAAKNTAVELKISRLSAL